MKLTQAGNRRRAPLRRSWTSPAVSSCGIHSRLDRYPPAETRLARNLTGRTPAEPRTRSSTAGKTSGSAPEQSAKILSSAKEAGQDIASADASTAPATIATCRAATHRCAQPHMDAESPSLLMLSPAESKTYPTGNRLDPLPVHRLFFAKTATASRSTRSSIKAAHSTNTAGTQGCPHRSEPICR